MNTSAEVIDYCEETLNLIADLPDEADDFAFSVEKKITSIRDWVSEHKRFTEKQVKALENMRSGIEKWLN